MRKSVKKISVVLPNYNYAKYFDKRMDSILCQTYPIYEIIVLDDCSTDNSIEVIKKKLALVKRQNPELKVMFIENRVNSGRAIAQWEKGFKIAGGDFVWIAEADDLSDKHFLEEVMKGFDDDEVMISYAESRIINGFGMMLFPNFRWSRDKEKTGHYKKSYIKDGKDEIREIMAIRCTIPNVSGVIFRNNKKILKYLDEAMKFTQVGDWYFYTKILENGKVSYNRKSLNKFRVHNGSVTRESNKGRRHYEEVKWMHNYFEKNYRLEKKVIAAMNSESRRMFGRIQV